jgi:hypothetical protein
MNNTNCLPEEDIQLLQQMIDLLPPGVYELPQIIGESWKHIGNPNIFGQLFRNTARAGRLRGICIADTTPGGHTTYRIAPQEKPFPGGANPTAPDNRTTP